MSIPRVTRTAGGRGWSFFGLLPAVLLLLPLVVIGPSASADEPESPITARDREGPVRRPFPPRRSPAARDRDEGGARSSGGWWFGTAGLALALAVCGAVSLASKRSLQGGSGSLTIVGRASLSPKHTVYLLKVGRQVLIVGAGPQGAPSLLGALTEPDELSRFVPAEAATVRFDRQPGDDE